MSEIKQQILHLCLYIAIIILLIFAVQQCTHYQRLANQNLIAMTDSIKHYKTALGESYASKTLLQGDIDMLHIVNDSLYQEIKKMKIKNPTSVVNVNSTIDNGTHDTIWQIRDNVEMIYPMITQQFDFSNRWRDLDGTVQFNDSTIKLDILHDRVYVDYTLAIEKNRVFVKSTNPYVEITNLQGIELPQSTITKKNKTSLVIGPSITYGYDFSSHRLAPSIGISLTYGLTIK